MKYFKIGNTAAVLAAVLIGFNVIAQNTSEKVGSDKPFLHSGETASRGAVQSH